MSLHHSQSTRAQIVRVSTFASLILLLVLVAGCSVTDTDQYDGMDNSPNGWLVIPGLIFFCLWAWALIDICQRRFEDVDQKIAWVIGILVGGGIGGILYLVVGRRSGEIPEQY